MEALTENDAWHFRFFVRQSVKICVPPGSPPDFFPVNSGAQPFEGGSFLDYSRGATGGSSFNSVAIYGLEQLCHGNLIEQLLPVLYPTDWQRA